MQRLLSFCSALALILLIGACGTATTETPSPPTTPTTTTTTTPTTTPAGNSMKGENYEITVLNADLPSPRKEMKGTIGGAKVMINYGSPAMKGRTIWGGLVPYGQVWRTGANEATRITFEQDVMVEGKELAAGTYGLFTIPTQTGWTVVFNKIADQWGAYEYDAAQDALRVTVAPKTASSSRENMDFMVMGNQLILQWNDTMVPITIKSA